MADVVGGIKGFGTAPIAFGDESQERTMTITNGVQFRRHYPYNTRASTSGMQSGSEWFTAKNRYHPGETT